MKEKLTDKKVAEIIQARYESEGYHELTPEQEKQGEENRRKLAEFMKKRREQREQEAR
ncbi:hypothetical protein LV469_02980 [Peptoniphilus sp. GNH]|nr:hypothetical protein LV469_02980 [Peptoniphilus sp. GNH]